MKNFGGVICLTSNKHYFGRNLDHDADPEIFRKEFCHFGIWALLNCTKGRWKCRTTWRTLEVRYRHQRQLLPRVWSLNITELLSWGELLFMALRAI